MSCKYKPPAFVHKPWTTDSMPAPSVLHPLVSICLPTLNARRFLEPRMQSIFDQTLTHWELIVCDSYSDDGTWEYLQQFKDDPRVRLYQVPKEGLYAGWNKCLERVRGEYVYIATADDTCSPLFLETMVGALKSVEIKKGVMAIPQEGADGYFVVPPVTPTCPSAPLFRSSRQLPADIAVCNFEYIDERGKVIKPRFPPAGAFYGDQRYKAHRRPGHIEFLVHLLIGTSWTTMTAVLFRNSLLKKTGLFVTDAGPLADRFWAYKSALYSDTVVVPDTLATWRQHPDQGSSPSRKRSMRAMRCLWRKTEAVFDECVTKLPVGWTSKPAYREKLLWAERRHYFDHYHLTRTCLRHSFLVFLSGAAKAAVLEPGYLCKRILNGLAWDVRDGVPERDYLVELMRAWDVPEVRANGQD